MSVKKSPVLKRNEYVKRFEILVQQEIASHNNKIFETNEQLNKFSKDVKELRKLLEERFKHLTCSFTDLGKHVDEKSEVDVRFEDFQNKLKVLEKGQRLLNNEIEDVALDQKELLTKKYFYLSIKDLETCFFDKIKILEDLVLNIEAYEKISERDIKDRLKYLSGMFMHQTSEIESQNVIIADLKRMVEESAFNSEYVQESMRKRQKTVFVLERKFEYLDTKIKKLEDTACE